MRIFRLIAGCFLLWPVRGLSQCDLNCLKKLWLEHQYSKVIDMGTQLRDKLEYKGIPALDYMIASSICQLHPDQPDGCILFHELTSDYYKDVSGADIDLLAKECNSICGRHHRPDPKVLDSFRYMQFASDDHSGGFVGHGKSFILFDEGLPQILNDPKKALSSVGQFNFKDRVQINRLTDERVHFFLSRRVPLGNRTAATRLAFRFSPNATSYISDRFICISRSSKEAELRTTSLELEKALNFFCSYFGFTPSGEYITVYLVDTYNGVNGAVKHIYNDQTTSFLIGYSNFFDNSMIVWVPGPGQVGTCKHELIHLLVRTRFSSLPHWLEEGLATLYEESRYTDSGNLVGVNNWRLALVKENFFGLRLEDVLMPDSSKGKFLDSMVSDQSTKFYARLEKTARDVGNYHEFANLFNMEKRELPNDISSFFQTYLLANKDALDRYFILYLQQNGKLPVLFRAFLNREKDMYSSGGYIPTERLILSTLGFSDMDSLQADFKVWLDKQGVGPNAG